jgi:hypothetical protein
MTSNLNRPSKGIPHICDIMQPDRGWLKVAGLFLMFYVLISLITGCGGGGGSTPTPPPPPPPESVTLTQSGGSVSSVGQSVTLAWSNSHNVSCTGTGLLTGTLAASGSQTVTLSTTGIVATSVTCDKVAKSVSLEVLAERTTIIDPVFEQALVTMGIDNTVDGSVLTSSILAVTAMGIDSGVGYDPGHGAKWAGTGSSYIQDATGLQNFRNLTFLKFEEQQVSIFNVAKMPALTFLSVWGNPVTSLDVSHNTALTTLGVSETSLHTLDTSALTNLVELDAQMQDPDHGGISVPYVRSNGTAVAGLTSLNVAGNANLTTLIAYGNRLTNLDLSTNAALTNASLSYNQLASVNVKGLGALHTLLVDNNALSSLDIVGTVIGLQATQQGIVTTGNPSLTQITVANAATETSWCTMAEAAWLSGNPQYGECVLDPFTTFVTGS